MADTRIHTNKVNITTQRTIEAILSDHPIAYHAILARKLRSVTAGVFLSQLLYWQARTQDAEGWIWKMQSQIYEETALGRREQETARRVLKRAGVVDEVRRGVPGKIHFRVNMERLIELLSTSGEEEPPSEEDEGNLLEQDEESGEVPRRTIHNGGKRQSTMAESANVQWRKLAPYNGGKRHSITESTSESTSETTSSNRSDAQTSRLSQRRRETRLPAPTRDPDEHAIIATSLLPLRQEFRDKAAAQVTAARVENVCHSHGIAAERGAGLLFEAAARTRESLQLGAIDGSMMAYFLACFEQLAIEASTARPARAARTSSAPPAQPHPVPRVVMSDTQRPSSTPLLPPEPALWSQVKHELQEILPSGVFASWVAPTVALSQSDTVLTVATHSAYHRSWLHNRLQDKITAALRTLGYPSIRVEFHVATTSSAAGGSPNTPMGVNPLGSLLQAP